MGRFFKIWPNLSQNWPKFKKILEKMGTFVQILAQNFADWYMNGYFFLKNWYLYGRLGLLSNSVAAHPYQNQT